MKAGVLFLNSMFLLIHIVGSVKTFLQVLGLLSLKEKSYLTPLISLNTTYLK